MLLHYKQSYHAYPTVHTLTTEALHSKRKCYPLEVVSRYRDPQLQVGKINHTFVRVNITLNPLSPHDALKHHFTSLYTDCIFLQLEVLLWKFP